MIDEGNFEGLDEQGQRITEGEKIELEPEDDVIRDFTDPKLPSAEEVEKHRVMGHVPYRNWCPICIQARGKDMSHWDMGEK